MIRRTSLFTTLAAVAVMSAGSGVFGQGYVVPAAPAQAGPSPKVLIIPFSTINVPDSQQWISKGVQENLVADFGRAGSYDPIAYQTQVIVEDNATAARMAKAASAPLAIRGAAQAVDGTIRLTAQLIDAKTADTVSTASVTGSVNDLLKLEDQLSAQLRGVSQAAPGVAAGNVAPATAPAPAAPQPVQPQIIVIMPQAQPGNSMTGYAGYDTYNPYSYGYGYGYGGFPYYPVIVTVSPVRHDRDHDHDGERDHRGGGFGGPRPIFTPQVAPVGNFRAAPMGNRMSMNRMD